MANQSLADFIVLRNQQIENQCQIQVRLRYVETLLEVSLTTTNFYNVPQSHLHEYFSLAALLIKELIALNQTSLKLLSLQT